MNFPSPREKLAGCCWLPRLLAKARLLQNGRLAPEYAARFCHPTGVDGQFLIYFLLTHEEIMAMAALPDSEAASWFHSRYTSERIHEWNRIAVNIGRPGYPLAERFPVALATTYKHIDSRGMTTIFEVLEADEHPVDTLVIIKPDSFWRNLNGQVENRLQTLGLTVVSSQTLAGTDNLPEDKWREFYFPAIGDRPPCLEGTSKYMAHGPVQVIHLRGPDAIQRVRQLVGKTRPWQAAPGTIRGDFWPEADAANAPYRLKFQQPGDDQFLFNMVHASDSAPSFAREIKFFDNLKA